MCLKLVVTMRRTTLRRCSPLSTLGMRRTPPIHCLYLSLLASRIPRDQTQPVYLVLSTQFCTTALARVAPTLVAASRSGTSTERQVLTFQPMVRDPTVLEDSPASGSMTPRRFPMAVPQSCSWGRHCPRWVCSGNCANSNYLLQLSVRG